MDHTAKKGINCTRQQAFTCDKEVLDIVLPVIGAGGDS